MRLHQSFWTCTTLFVALANLAAQPATAQGITPTVAVMYFNNSSLLDHDTFEPVRRGIADILITEFQRNRGIQVVERDALQKTLEEQDLATAGRVDPETAAKVGKVLGAQHMVVGGFFVDRKGTLRLDARAVNVETSRVEYTESITGKVDDVLQLIAALAAKMNDGMRLPGKITAPPSNSRPPSEPAKSNPAASPWAAVQTYARALTEDDKHDVTKAVAYYRQALEQLPSSAVDQRTRAENRLKQLVGGGG